MQGDPLGGIVGSAFKNAIFDVDTSRPITANSEDNDGDTLTKVGVVGLCVAAVAVSRRRRRTTFF